MLKGLLVVLSFLNLISCDAGLDSNIKSTEQEEIVDKVNKASMEEIDRLDLIGEYEAQLISKKVDPARQKKFEINYNISILKFPSKATLNGKQVPLYNVKAIITYSPRNKDFSSVDFPVLLANVYFSSFTREIAIVLGSETGATTGPGSGSVSNQIFLATGTIEPGGFKMNKIYSSLGEFEPALFYKTKNP